MNLFNKTINKIKKEKFIETELFMDIAIKFNKILKDKLLTNKEFSKLSKINITTINNISCGNPISIKTICKIFNIITLFYFLLSIL